MIRGRCPICAQPYEIDSLSDLPSFPFCSDRCKTVDLGRWIDGRYSIPLAEPTAPNDDEVAADEDE